MLHFGSIKKTLKKIFVTIWIPSMTVLDVRYPAKIFHIQFEGFGVFGLMDRLVNIGSLKICVYFYHKWIYFCE